jgi:putative MATE family efflux protein
MEKRRDLTQGPILSSLVMIALPIMSTSFLQMAYNMADMFWIGRVGYDAVSAVGTAGFYMWLSMGIVRLSQVGAEVGVAQSLGAKDEKRARSVARSALQFAVFTAILYTLFVIAFRKPLIGFFAVPNEQVNAWALSYLSIVAIGFTFSFVNLVFSGIYNGSGNSKMPFIFNAIGLAFNMILDPILIFGWLGAPTLGVTGAAIATVFAQFIVMMCFVIHIESKGSPFSQFHFFRKPEFDRMRQIIKIGLPVAIQSMAFTFFAMLIARRLSNFGDMPIAIQKVGSQIESISWMTAIGFSTALGAFVGQNYGAGAFDRIKEGYKEAFKLMLGFGLVTSFALILGAEPIFSIFIPDPEVIPQGAVYLRILGVSQLFMCLEISTAGAFNGLGRTVPPSVVSIVFTGLRVPFAYYLSSEFLLGLNGVWWSISMSSVFKGVVLVAWFIWILKRDPLFKGGLADEVVSLS